MLFGPRKLTRAGFQTRFVDRFEVPENVVAPYTITLSNGDEMTGGNRVIDASVLLNGSPVFGSGAINLQSGTLNTSVKLFSTNTIEVTFLSTESAFLTITIEGFRAFPARRPPVITGVSPSEGAVGTEVTLTGTDLISTYTTDQSFVTVSFAGPNATRRLASIISATLTQVKVFVPNGAVTGPIELVNDQGRTVTGNFSIRSELDFQLVAAPASLQIIQRSVGVQTVGVVAGRPDFTQLVSLSVSGLPAGVTAQLEPSQITAGALANVNISLENANLSPGVYPYTITGVTQVDGRTLTRQTQASINVLPSGQTTLSGRVLSTEKEPIVNASVSVGSRATQTDAAGNFILTEVPVGPNVAIKIDGRTASAPGRSYPEIQEPALIVSGQTNVNPYIFYLPPIDTQYEVTHTPTQNTDAENPRVPGLKMTVPANSGLRNRDGSSIARLSITPLPPDRTPAPLPNNIGMNVVYTSQPGGAIPNTGVRIPVEYPNLGGANPGTQIALWAFDHDSVQWYNYGLGTVSPDGRKIIPNPGVGIRDFSWHGPATNPAGNVGGPGGGGGPPCQGECCDAGPGAGGSGGAGGGPGGGVGRGSNNSENPVDLSNGIKIESNTDIEFGGSRGSLRLTRIYTSDLGQVLNLTGPFGRGTTHNYDVRLIGTFNQGGSGRVAMPGEIPVQPQGTTVNPGRLFSYLRTDPDGTWVFTSLATTSQLGDTVRRLPTGEFEYRYPHGDLLKFDTNRRLTQLVDRNGNVTSLIYTGNNLTSITDAVGRSITLTYDTSGRIARATDPLNREWQYFYENGANLTRVIDPSLSSTTYGYTGNGLMSSVRDNLNVVTKQVEYQLLGGAQRVVRQTFADGSTEAYRYIFAGNAVTETEVREGPVARVRRMRFNVAGQILDRTDELGQVVRTTRDLGTNLPTAVRGSCGCTEETRTFDANGFVTSQTDRQGGVTTHIYDPNRKLITQTTDKLNRITAYTYDQAGNLTSVRDPLNQVTNYAYNGSGQLTSITDPLNHTTSFEYDASGNMTAIVDPLNHRTTIEYDAVGRRTAIVNALNRRTSYAYDPLDRLTSVTDPNNKTTAFTYDANGNLLTRRNALNQTTTFAYDAKNNLTSTTDPLGNVTKFTYNKDDELIAVRSPLGRITRYSYDGRGQVRSITDALNNTVQFAYDNQGNLASLSDERANITTFTYDELSRLIGRRDPLGRLTSYEYDAEGNLRKSTDRMGRVTTMIYDGLNRPTQVNYPDAQVNYAYDAAGRMTGIVDTQGGTIARTYDNADRLLSETTSSGIVAYTYNNADQRVSMTADNRPPVTYAYDPAGRLRTITQGAEVFTYSYDDLSRVAAMLRPNGVRTEYGYDNAGRIARINHLNSLDQILEDFQFTYNRDSEIEAIASPATAQLLASNRAASPADAANRITQFGGATYAFNLEGQTTSKTDTTGTTNYTWDSRGRLTQAALPSGQTVDYAYDALGRRRGRSAGGSTTQFLYDGEDVVRDKNSSAGVEYVNGFGIDNKLRQSTLTSGSLYFLQDQLGSTKALTDAVGSVVERSQYEVFGSSAGSLLTRFGYTGREHEGAAGLIYYRARWMDPIQGRFLTEDPEGAEGGINLYTYVANNPTSSIDPRGTIPLLLLPIIVGGSFGLLGQGISDFVEGCGLSSGSKYAAAFGLGAAGGVATAYFPGAAIAVGAAQGGLMSALDGDGLGEVAFNTVLGGVTSGLGKFIPKINGITKGRNNFNAIGQGKYTRLRGGAYAEDVSLRTTAKVLAGDLPEFLVGTGISEAVNAGKRRLTGEKCGCK